MTVEVNKEPFATISKGNSNLTVPFDDTRNYKVKFFSDEENAVRLSFFLDEVHYGDFNEIPEDAKQRCDPGPLQDYSFKFKQGSDECLNIWYQKRRNWNIGFEGACIMITTKGRDGLWAGILLPSAAVIIFVLLGAIVVVSIAHRVYTTPPDTPVLMRNVDSDSSLRDQLLEQERTPDEMTRAMEL